MWVSYVLSVLTIIKIVEANLYTAENPSFVLDFNLYKTVLDPQQCQRQIQYLRQDNSFLLAQFIDAGLRIPKGILLGNLQDFGLYPQCLGIKEVFEDMSIEGKYCSISVPVNQYITINYLSDADKYSSNPKHFKLFDETKTNIKKYKKNLLRYMRFIFGNAMDNRITLDTPVSNIAFRLALCIPKVCTTEEALSGLLHNFTTMGFNYEDVGCRLPNDKPWMTADYIAIFVFSILGVLTLLSTSYDVHHSFIKKRDPKEACAIFASFSAYTNCRRILIIKSNPGAIECLDGIRALAIYWVVAGHVFFVANFYVLNIFDVFEWTQSFSSIWIMTSPSSVDTFFLLSGLLLVYTTIGKLTANQLLTNLPGFYLSRLLRMFPVLAALILFEASLLNRLGDGPNWEIIVAKVQNCRTFWWSTLLHLQNYINPQEACLGVSWYLAIDVNLHILSPLVLFWVLGRKRRLAVPALATALVISMIIAKAFIYSNEFSEDTYYKYYVNILARSPPFFIGMIYGYFLKISSGKMKMPNIVGILLTILSIVLIGAVVYCNYLGDQPQLASNTQVQKTFNTFLRPIWALALGWIILACHNGYADPINWFLSLNIWKIPARISYAMYLFHISFILAVYSSTLQPIYFSINSTMFDFMGFLAIAHVVSFLLTALIDSPFAILFKIYLSKGSKLQTSNNKSISTNHALEHSKNGNRLRELSEGNNKKQY